MSISSLTKLHTPCHTLSFSTVSKEKHLFQSVTMLNPVFQPILTVTILTVNNRVSKMCGRAVVRPRKFFSDFAQNLEICMRN